MSVTTTPAWPARVLNTAQQIGGSLGTALLNTLFAGAVTAYLTDNLTDPSKAPAQSGSDALIHGYHVAFFWGAMLLLGGLVVAALVINAKKTDVPKEGAVMA